MDRKEAVQTLALLTGGLVASPTISLLLDEGSNNIRTGKGTQFTKAECKMVLKMVDAIIPRTKVPGAVDAGVPSFVMMMIQECYPTKDQKSFHEGLSNFDQLCKTKYRAYFLKLLHEKQVKEVKYLDSNVLGKKNNKQKLNEDTTSFYRNLKGLTLLGYYSSKPGATEALRYVKVPGHYDGCLPYHKGDKEWAT
jgi:uncharacterized lipoprotein YehR (DUF1307 family)